MAISSKSLEELVAGIKEIFDSDDINVDLYMSLQNKIYTMFKTDAPWNTGEINVSSRFVFMCRKIYARIIDFLKTYVRDKYHINYIIRSDEEYIANYIEEADKFKRNSKILEGICAPVHFYWINNVEKQLKKKPFDMYEMALNVWDAGILHRSFPILNETIFNLLTIDRSGNNIDKSLLRNGILSYTEQTQGVKTQSELIINQYRKQFTKEFLEKTMNFYTQVADDLMENYNLFEYVLYVQKRFIDEHDRVVALNLPPNWNIVEQIDEVCEDALIGHKFESISHGFIQLLKSGNPEHAVVVYHFLKEFRYNSDLVNVLKQTIISDGYNAIRNCDATNCVKIACKYAEAVAKVLNKYNSLLNKYFPNERKMQVAVAKATKKFFNPNIFTVTKCENPDLIYFDEYRKCLEESHKLFNSSKIRKGG